MVGYEGNSVGSARTQGVGISLSKIRSRWEHRSERTIPHARIVRGCCTNSDSDRVRSISGVWGVVGIAVFRKG
jgi:hypothetical protein